MEEKNDHSNIELLNNLIDVQDCATLVCQVLKNRNIDVVLTGGSCMEIYTNSNYSSLDLDFIANPNVKTKQVISTMLDLGFHKTKDGYFKYKDNPYFIEFPTGPISVGDERVHKTIELKSHVGTLKLLSPTDCVKDRLCAYYYHNGKECYPQAVAVAHSNIDKIDFENLKAWVKKEKSDIKNDLTQLLKDLETLKKPKTLKSIKEYLKSKEESNYVNIDIETEFIELTDDLLNDYVIYELLNIELGDNTSYYEKMSKLYFELLKV
ncbi:hypothetical protein [Arcobacter sp. YIC-310]|uniref:hypothetical protein n=1 Tax=Arcobacter sp. YIC-310 TaxID=3376632 RepID=UPI003C226828